MSVLRTVKHMLVVCLRRMQDFLLTDDGWRAASQLPNLRELIVEGVVLTEPMPGIMTRLEELTLNKVTPAQLVSAAAGAVWDVLRTLHVMAALPASKACF